MKRRNENPIEEGFMGLFIFLNFLKNPFLITLRPGCRDTGSNQLEIAILNKLCHHYVTILLCHQFGSWGGYGQGCIMGLFDEILWQTYGYYETVSQPEIMNSYFKLGPLHDSVRWVNRILVYKRSRNCIFQRYSPLELASVQISPTWWIVATSKQNKKLFWYWFHACALPIWFFFFVWLLCTNANRATSVALWHKNQGMDSYIQTRVVSLQQHFLKELYISFI